MKVLFYLRAAPNSRISEAYCIYEYMLYNTYFNSLVKGCLARGWHFEALRLPSKRKQFFKNVIAQYKPDAVITNLEPIDEEDFKYWRRWAKEHPFVRLSNVPDNPESLLYSYIDVPAGIQKAVLHFKSEGFTRVDFLKKPGKNSLADSRFESLKNASVQHGLKEARLFEMPWDERETIRWLKQADKPEALICFNDVYAYDFVGRLNKNGLKSPEDIAVMGFDGVPSATPLIKISTVSYRWDQVGENALKLIEENRGPYKKQARRSILLAPELMGGESSLKKTKTLKSKNRAFVQKAHEILEIAFCEKNCVEQAAQACHVGAAHFQRLFKTITGLSFTHLILDKRLHFLANKIIDTSAPIYPLAELAGFKNHIYFYRAFKKKFGITPKEYRVKTTENTI